MLCGVLVVFILVVVSPSPFSAATNTNSVNFNEWFNQLNAELRVIYQNAAHFAWELSVNPDQQLASDSNQFDAMKSKWINMKCAEINEFLSTAYRYPFTATLSNLTLLELVTDRLCAGPKFTEYQASELSNYLYEMQTIFTETQVCLPKHLDLCLNLDWIWDFTFVQNERNNIETLDLSNVAPFNAHKTELCYYSEANTTDDNFMHSSSHQRKIDLVKHLRAGQMMCFDGESDLDRIMSGDFSLLNRSDCALRFNEIFHWAWESWRAAVGNKIGDIYPYAISLMNIGSKNNGYDDIGDVWRQEVDLPNLQETINSLMHQVKPFYQLLHAMLRNVLWKRFHQFNAFQRDGTIPAHLLGSMWSQNWKLYENLIHPFTDFNLDDSLTNTNWSSIDMVKRADDFYRSLNLPAMTQEFWQQSVFEKSDSFNKCHGTAANMYQPNDYRMIVCARPSIQDLYVIVHEMGHLQYYMAYADQPTIFQDGNAAVQESIGDAIFLGLMTPQHLNRLHLLPDKYLFASTSPKFNQFKRTRQRNLKINDTLNNDAYEFEIDNTINDFDLSLLLQMALTKIPQIPFEYLMDIYRWNLFNGTVSISNANSYFWMLAHAEQGIHPPEWKNRKDFFDPGAKFHVADNTPYVRYFLASFLHVQIFRGLCEVTVYGYVNPKKPLPMPLHRCDIYGSKRAGNLLKKALKLGTSVHWSEVLFMLTGSREVSADALLLYYKPLIVWIEKQVIDHKIPVGW